MKKSTNMVTKEPVRLSYIHLLEPREAQAGQKPKYDAQLIIPKTCTKVIEQINQMVQYARDNAVQDGRAWAKTAKSPLRDGDGERPNGGNYGPECKGCMVMNASSTRKPGIVDRKNGIGTKKPDDITSRRRRLQDWGLPACKACSDSRRKVARDQYW